MTANDPRATRPGDSAALPGDTPRQDMAVGDDRGMSCTRPEPQPIGTCITALAAGWINPPDLCPACTQAFMAALDGIAGPLSWHQSYLDRSGVECVGGTR